MAQGQTHPLQNNWVLWELKHFSEGGDYGNALRPVFEFSTVEEFWRYWTFLPKPKEIFTDAHGKKTVDGRSIKAFGLFKRGIMPKWEDEANQYGCELVATKAFPLDLLDTYWENLVLGLIGETIDDGNEICGCRVVDQSKKGKVFYKLELWLRSKSDSVTSSISTRLKDVLTDGESSKPNSKVKAPEFEVVKRK